MHTGTMRWPDAEISAHLDARETGPWLLLTAGAGLGHPRALLGVPRAARGLFLDVQTGPVSPRLVSVQRLPGLANAEPVISPVE